MPGINSDIGKLQTLINAAVYNNVNQDDQSAEALCLTYRKVIFFVSIAAAGAEDPNIELQIFLQVFDGTNWYDVVDTPFRNWKYNHSSVLNSVRPSAALVRESLSWEITAPKFRVDVRSPLTTATQTFTLTLKAIGIP